MSKKRVRNISFVELASRYHEEHSLIYCKRPLQYQRMLEMHALPILGLMPITTINSETIRKLHLQLGKTSGRYLANRVVSIIKAIFNFGIRIGIFGLSNPCYPVRPFPSFTRDRFLSQEELVKFFQALSMEKEILRDYFSLLLFTGVRKSNLLAMKWQDIDLKRRKWRIAPEETKNGEVNIVLLAKPAIKILRRRLRQRVTEGSSSPWVFPGRGKTGHIWNPVHCLERLRKRTGIDDVRLHDLRRTFGSYMAISGSNLHIIGTAMNHKSLASTEIYARLSQEPVVKAIEKTVKMLKKYS